jgi:regulator of protease activity HflC (stomatin/prohibitin superfamily)
MAYPDYEKASKRGRGDEEGPPRWPPTRIAAYAGIGIFAIFCISMLGGFLETVDAGEIVVRQGFFSGDLTFWKDAGPKLQLWGKVTHYQKSSQYWFSSKSDQGDPSDQSIQLRFNDGGHGKLSGSVRYNLPTDDARLRLLHERFGSQKAIDQSLIRTVIEKSVYLSGSLMSSTQSFAERRNDLLGFIEDQSARGVYKSSSKCEKQDDPVTKAQKTVCNVELTRDDHGLISRVEVSPLEVYGIQLSNFAINELKYDDTVDQQIKAQQSAIAAIQTSAAQARQAEQGAITAAENGKAQAATAKWKQEVIKAEKVTEAEQVKEVARLAKEAAEFKKQEQILLGEGEAARKKAVMMADGALEKKLAALVEINNHYADAFGKQTLVPQVVMGNGGGNAGGNASALVDLLTASTARQLGLSLQIPNGASVATKK